MSIFSRHDLDQESQAVVMHRTWELAMTGKYRNFDHVLQQLTADNLKDAQHWLADKLVRSKIDEVCSQSLSAANKTIPLIEASRSLPDDEAIWHVLRVELASFWMKRFETYAPCFVQADRFRFHAWVREEGLTMRTGWDAFAARVREDMDRDPIPNPYHAFETVLDSRNLTIAGDMAWCTYSLNYKTSDLRGFRGPGNEEDVRVFERHDGIWRTAFYGFMNLNFAQTDAPLWEIDTGGAVIWQNPAARVYQAGESEAVIRGGKLRMRDASADERLQEAIRQISDQDFGFLSRRRSMPVVVEQGHDLPSLVWWVAAEHGKLTVTYNNQPLLLARLETATKAFGLSPAQHRLASAVVDGVSLTDIAEREGISLGTAKTQLQRIFDKVGVRTQPALVRALLAVTERN